MPPTIEPNAQPATRRSRHPVPAPGPDLGMAQGAGPEAKHVRIPDRDSALHGQAWSPRRGRDTPPVTWVAPPPRTSLCARVTRWLALLTGLGAIGLRIHSHRLTHDTPPLALDTSAPPTPAPTSPPDASRPSETPGAASLDPAHAQQEVPRIGEDSESDLFEAFRESPDYREPRKLEAFMRAMIRAFRHSPAEIDAHLPTLLRVWRWTYGETFRAPDGRELNVGALMTSSIVPPVVAELGGPHMSRAQLQQLVRTVCQAPENIPPLLRDPAILATHARWSARALTQLIRLTAPSPLGASVAQRQEAEEAQLRRCLDMVREMPSLDPRWKPLLMQSLQAQGPAAPLGLVMAPERWAEVISQALLQPTQATTQSSRMERRPPTDRAGARA